MKTAKTKSTIINGKEVKYYNDKQKPIVYNSESIHYEVLVKWENHMRNVKYSMQNTYNYKRQMIYLLNFLEKENIYDLSTMDKNVVLNYMNNYPSYYRKTTIKNYNKCLRVMLRFLFQENLTKKDLSIFVPTIKVSKVATVPSAWNDDDVKEIFKNINTNSDTGNRLYLALLLAFRYGLRSCDIRDLKFENINWKDKTIKLIQSKTKKEVSFPLLPEVYSALVDYIKNHRPKSDETYVLLNKKGKYLGHYNFHENIQVVLSKTSIDCKNKKRGIHTMRHTLASSLLNNDIPMHIISDILGQSNRTSTLLYSKIDKNNLVKCCLLLDEVTTHE